MSDVQRQQAAKTFVQNWTGKGYEKGESQPFWLALLNQVFGIAQPETFITFENQVKLDHTSFIDGYIPSTHTMIEQKSLGVDLDKKIKQSDGSELTPYEQARRYANQLPYSKRPRWIVTCNFSSFQVYDMEEPDGAPVVIELADLEKDYYRLEFLVNPDSKRLAKEAEVSTKAGELVSRLYNLLVKQYKDPDSAQSQKALNILCVRLVFCLYAEDARIFTRNLFHDYLERYDARDFRKQLLEIFDVLNTPDETRDPYLDTELAKFPYTNGGLFAEKVEIPNFTDEIRNLLLNDMSLGFDWSPISPTIFGAMFESTLNPTTRRQGGMHYTSIENIHKVIDPLFLDDLNEEFEKIKKISDDKKRRIQLAAFQNKLASLKFLDPACGSGNFLTEAYVCLRRLENKIILDLLGGQRVLGAVINPVKVSLDQFYGIEINDFAVSVAATALWIAESQMLAETESIICQEIEFLPLKSYHHIVEANALRIDWESLLSPTPGPSPVGRGESKMYFRTANAEYYDDLKVFARENRKNPTPAENVLWQALRKDKLGYNFRRQHAIHVYIVDFVCLEKKLVVEVDGEYHEDENQQYCDEQRTHDLNALGFNVIRFTNNEVINDLHGVLAKIKEALNFYSQENLENMTNAKSSNAAVPLPNGEGLGVGLHFNFIMGNPPFSGARMMTNENKADVEMVFHGVKNAGNLDLVTCWFKIAADLMLGTQTKCAFVSTNSISQGEQPAILWQPLFEKGIHINFGYETFIWDNEAQNKAHVHCVITGFSHASYEKDRILYKKDGQHVIAKQINGYMIDGPCIAVTSISKPLCHVPGIGIGNKPIDGGFYLFTEDEMKDFIKKEPASEKYFKKWIGADEFINRYYRYCLWLGDCSPSELSKLPECMNRVRAVKEYRLASKSEGTRKIAEKPTRFHVENMPKGTYIVVPQVSSERRCYIPMGYEDDSVLCSDKVRLMPEGTLYHFGILMSSVHMAWMRVVSCRLKSDYSYTINLVYNNFPWPEIDETTDAGKKQKARIELSAQGILDARALYPDSSLADLYDPDLMPVELRKAHQANDKAVMDAYGFAHDMTEPEVVAELFKRYQILIDAENKQKAIEFAKAEEAKAAKPKRTRKKKCEASET